jgi:hypothetical protein
MRELEGYMREPGMGCQMQSELDRSFVRSFSEVARVGVLEFAIAGVGVVLAVTAGIYHWEL